PGADAAHAQHELGAGGLAGRVAVDADVPQRPRLRGLTRKSKAGVRWPRGANVPRHPPAAAASSLISPPGPNAPQRCGDSRRTPSRSGRFGREPKHRPTRLGKAIPRRPARKQAFVLRVQGALLRAGELGGVGVLEGAVALDRVGELAV